MSAAIRNLRAMLKREVKRAQQAEAKLAWAMAKIEELTAKGPIEPTVADPGCCSPLACHGLDAK